MALHVYVKEQYSLKKRLAHIFSYISLVMGTLLLFWSFYPILSFEIVSRLTIQNEILAPIPASALVSSLSQAQSVLGTNTVFSSNLRDFVPANLWFPSMPQNQAVEKQKEKEKAEEGTVTEYTLSIPKLNISGAKVTVGGEDLAHSLIHYLPTSMPGQKGNVAIFGHSTLPQLYNPKDYKTIFTYLPSLEKGDKIEIKVRDTTYQYEVYDMFVVKPEQVSVLEQKYDAAYLTVVTCVPPGTFWNRLIVRAKMIDNPDN